VELHKKYDLLNLRKRWRNESCMC